MSIKWSKITNETICVALQLCQARQQNMLCELR